MTFREFLKTLKLGELLWLISDMRQHKDDRQHLNWALIELGERQGIGEGEQCQPGASS